MNITDYTSGPWKAKDQWGYIKIHSKDEGVCAVHGLGVNSQANARLIASAPDLLSAVDSCLEIMIRAIGERLPIQQGTECEETDWQTAIRNARAALRKAKGEE
jgi:hypothetical protein